MKPGEPGAARRLEGLVAARLKALVEGIPIGATFVVEPSADLCSPLELFLPYLLALRYEDWRHESLDGFRVASAHKTGPAAVQMVGTAILITDQTVTPFLAHLAASAAGDAIDSYRVFLGEPGGGRLGISGPACHSASAINLLSGLPARIGRVPWSYRVESDRIPRSAV